MQALTSNAAVFERDWRSPGDRLLTYDDVNQREWLDLTETQLFKFPGNSLEDQLKAVVNETLPGGSLAGFDLADDDEVFALAESAGIDTSTLSLAKNQSAAQVLVSLLGVTSGNSSFGTIGSIDGRSGDFIGYAIFSRTGGAGIEFRLGVTPFGVWLYRSIPEPSSKLMAAVVCYALLPGHRSWKRRSV